MDDINELQSDQVRQTVDTEQVFIAYEAAHIELSSRFKGSMSWKTVHGSEYLYRKTGEIWKSLGPRSQETELIFERFHTGRSALKEREDALAARLDQMAAINRAMRLGRIPQMTARIIRAAGDAGLVGTALYIAGTNALYLYERLAGVQISNAVMATTDIDLLLDSRQKLKFLGSNISETVMTGLLRKVDKSFTPMKQGAYRAANDRGFLVDIIRPATKNKLQEDGSNRFSDHIDDLKAIEIDGLQWLINSPRAEGIVLDERGYPVRVCCPDPRAFALHKLWLSKRPDRDPAKKRRDAAQANILAQIVVKYLPHLSFETPYVTGLPGALKALLPELLAYTSAAAGGRPNW